MEGTPGRDRSKPGIFTVTDRLIQQAPLIDDTMQDAYYFRNSRGGNHVQSSGNDQEKTWYVDGSFH
jgi:hypothetical protein